MIFDPSSALTRYAPGKGVTTLVSFTGASSAWAQINATAAPRYYTFACTQDCFVVAGPSNVGAAANTDFLYLAGIHDFIIKPGDGIRVISNGVDGILTVAPTGV